MKSRLFTPAAMKTIAAVLLLSCVAGCATQPAEAPKPVPREEPLNSLALEQCVRENGPETCLDGSK